MLDRKSNIDLLVIHFALKRNLVTKKCWPGNRDDMVKPGSHMPLNYLQRVAAGTAWDTVPI